MAIWQDVWQLGQKVLALTKTTETNTSEIKKPKQQQLKLTRKVIRLKQELESTSVAFPLPFRNQSKTPC